MTPWPIDFSLLAYDRVGKVSDHKMTVKGTGEIKVVYSISKNKESLRIDIIEKKTTEKSNGEKEIKVSNFKDLSGNRITFTAYYE